MNIRTCVLTTVCLFALCIPRGAATVECGFRRGDMDHNCMFEITDPITMLSHLWLGFPIYCQDAFDVNDNGLMDIGDAIYSFQFQFTGESPAPLEPFHECGQDLTPDDLGCEMLSECIEWSQ